MRTNPIAIRPFAVAAAALACMSVALADPGLAPRRQPERPDMPFLPGDQSPRLSVPVDGRSSSRAVPVFIKQINTTPAGLNIVGDAANEPSLAVNPADPRRLAAGWRQFDTIASSFRQAGVAYSRDGGHTWTKLPPLEAGIFRSDPVLRFSPTGEKLFYNSLRVVGNNFDVWYFISGDSGATWSAPQAIPGGDKTWFTIDTTLSTGRENHYTFWNVASNPTPGFTFARSITAGSTFQSPLALPGGPPIFGTLGIGPAGQVYMSGTNAGAPGLSVARSSNAANPAVTPTFAASSPPIGGDLALNLAINPGGLAGQVICDADRSGGPGNGYVYICASIDPDTGADPLECRFIRSRDGGATWDPFVRVNDDAPTTNAFQWFTTMSVAPNGRIDVIYNDTRDDTVSNRLSKTYYTFSTNQGATFAPSQAITIQWNPLLGFPQQNKIGDYYDMTSDNVGASAIISTTFNGEQDVYFVRIGDFDCNANGIGDAADIASGASKDCNGDTIPDECQIVCKGDINGDGVTNTADLTLLLGKFGQTVPLCDPANLNNDTTINTADLTTLLSGFGCPN